ncbi:MAG TPA: phosphonoacetaldehyde reductase [Ruminococcus sp.]|nr:phosphonoacetaldehyde reductase [Ruminococcus sp.]
MKDQIVFRGTSGYHELENYISELHCKRLMLVCGRSLSSTRAGAFFDRLPGNTEVEIVRFSGFSPNPSYEEAVKGVELFRSEKCDGIIAAGGGSAMDTAKCIKAFAKMQDSEEWIKQPITSNEIPIIAIPTTAGTGSEITRYAVVYYNGKKFSVTHESIIPDAVLLDAELLSGLPELHKVSAMLDALCHAIESFWSVNSTSQSRALSRRSIGMILQNMDGYLSGESSCAEQMLDAAYISGQAINITATTAGHAMSYELTGEFGMTHGHAVAVCVPEVYRYMLENPDKLTDHRGNEYFQECMRELAFLLGEKDPLAAYEKLRELPIKLGMELPVGITEDLLEQLAKSVDPGRLKNNPVLPDKDGLKLIYRRIFNRSSI